MIPLQVSVVGESVHSFLGCCLVLCNWLASRIGSGHAFPALAQPTVMLWLVRQGGIVTRVAGSGLHRPRTIQSLMPPDWNSCDVDGRLARRGLAFARVTKSTKRASARSVARCRSALLVWKAFVFCYRSVTRRLAAAVSCRVAAHRWRVCAVTPSMGLRKQTFSGVLGAASPSMGRVRCCPSFFVLRSAVPELSATLD
jgi:hypothetical protein